MIWEKLHKYLEVFINRGENFMSEIIYRNTFDNIENNNQASNRPFQ